MMPRELTKPISPGKGFGNSTWYLPLIDQRSNFSIDGKGKIAAFSGFHRCFTPFASARNIKCLGRTAFYAAQFGLHNYSIVGLPLAPVCARLFSWTNFGTG